MPILYRSHRSAASAEFAAGIPGDWPQIERVVPDGYQLSQGEQAAGFEVLSHQAWTELKAIHAAAFEAWQAARRQSEAVAEDTRRTDGSGILADLRLIAASQSPLTTAQLSNAVRVCARALLHVERILKE